MSTRKIAIWVITAVLALALLAGCGGKATTPAGEATAAQATAGAPSATKAPAQPSPTPVPPTDTPVPTQPAAAAETPQAIEDVSKLPWLKSYRMRLTLETSGEAYAEEAGNKLEMIGEFVKEPPAMRYVIIGSTPEDSMEMIRIGNQSWLKMGESWIQSTDESAAKFGEEFMLFEPEDLSKDWKDLSRVGKETVNNIQTTHYKFDKQTFLTILTDEETRTLYQNLDIAEVDFYLADEGYIVKMVTLLSGKGVNSNKPDLAGEMKTTYEIYDLNAPIEITPPSVPSATEGMGFTIPEPAGAKQTMSQQGMVMYAVANMSLADAAEFYKKGFTDQGLTYLEDSSMVSEKLATLSFEGKGAAISVMISPDQSAGGLAVIVSIEKKE
ncbi:MAG: hypothetical protein ACUVWB_13285 [Anaerolineae bacterium]